MDGLGEKRDGSCASGTSGSVWWRPRSSRRTPSRCRSSSSRRTGPAPCEHERRCEAGEGEMGGGTRKGDGRRGRGGVLLLLKQSGGPHCEAEKWTGPPARSTQIRRRGDLERHRVDGALSESMVVQHRHVVGLCDGPQSRFCRPGHAALDVGQAAGCRLDMARGAWRARHAVPSPAMGSRRGVLKACRSRRGLSSHSLRSATSSFAPT